MSKCFHQATQPALQNPQGLCMTLPARRLGRTTASGAVHVRILATIILKIRELGSWASIMDLVHVAVGPTVQLLSLHVPRTLVLHDFGTSIPRAFNRTRKRHKPHADRSAPQSPLPPLLSRSSDPHVSLTSPERMLTKRGTNRRPARRAPRGESSLRTTWST